MIAPGNRRSQRLLTSGDIAGSVREHLQATLQAGEQSLWRKYSGAGGSQLDCQRETVQANTDFSNGAHSVLRHLKTGLERLHTSDKEGTGSILREGFAVWQLLQIGQGQRGHNKLVFALQTQWGTAGHEQVQVWAGG